jgi:hypothetical protein
LSNKGIRIVALIAGISFVVLGLVALVSPRWFFENLGNYPPFNEHFIHDIGSFDLGIGAGLLAALRVASGLSAALVAAAVGSSAHAVAHIMDRGQGGDPSHPYVFSVLALILVWAAITSIRKDTDKAPVSLR